MKRNDDLFIPCVVQPDVSSGAACDTQECVFAQSVRRLVVPDLSDEELKQLGFKRSVGTCHCEEPESVKSTSETAQTTSRMLEATMNVIADQIRNVDLEAEMLTLRKRALKRRLRILEKLAKSLKPSDEDRKAA